MKINREKLARLQHAHSVRLSERRAAAESVSESQDRYRELSQLVPMEFVRVFGHDRNGQPMPKAQFVKRPVGEIAAATNEEIDQQYGNDRHAVAQVKQLRTLAQQVVRARQLYAEIEKKTAPHMAFMARLEKFVATLPKADDGFPQRVPATRLGVTARSI